MSARGRTHTSPGASLFSVTYSIVDSTTLEALPIAEKLTSPEKGLEGPGWVPGTAMHQVRLRTTRPGRAGAAMARRLATQVARMNSALRQHGAVLLPGGAHPLLPASEALTWDDDRDPFHFMPSTVFDRHVHGHVNTQGLHLGIPFRTDSEFAKLHAAVRLLAPILPALTAASPLLEGRHAGFMDAGSEASLHTHEDRPELMGTVIPEAVFSQEDYDRQVLGPIAQAMAPYATAGPPDPEVLNTRAAVPFFDRGVLELRALETQEHPMVDMAISEFVMAVLKALMTGRWVSTYLQRAWNSTDLLPIHLQVIKDAGRTLIANRDYLIMFGLLKQERMTASRLWQHLFVELYDELGEETRLHVGNILEKGCLASRILERTGRTPSPDVVRTVYQDLAGRLADARMFQ